MREISWDDFYERFFDWAESTRRTRIGDLTGYGPADEVYDIAMELSYDDDRTAARFLGRAAEAGVRFTPEQILEFALIVDEKTLGRMAKAADPAFTVRELEEIESLLSEADFAAAARKSGLLQPKKAVLPKKAARPEKIGFLAKLAAVFAMPGEKKRPAAAKRTLQRRLRPLSASLRLPLRTVVLRTRTSVRVRVRREQRGWRTVKSAGAQTGKNFRTAY